MKKLIVIIFLVLAGFWVKAQVDTVNLIDPDIKINKRKDPGDVRGAIIKIFTKNINRDLYYKTPKDSVYFVSVAVSFNAKGEIDTVLFSKKISDHTMTVLGLNNKLIDIYKKHDLSSFNYRNQVVLFPVLFVQFQDKNILLNKNFFFDYQNLWPEFGSVLNNKKLVLLEPYINFHGIIYKE